jgi:hypothetical protein
VNESTHETRNKVLLDDIEGSGMNKLEEKNVEWLEKVSDEEYTGRLGSGLY